MKSDASYSEHNVKNVGHKNMVIEFMPHGRIALIHFLAWDTFLFCL